MSDTENLLRELVAAQTARADTAERALAAALTQIESLRADAEHAREVRRRDAERKSRVRGQSAEIPGNVHGNSTDSPRTDPPPASPPSPSPDSPHTPHITPTTPPAPPSPRIAAPAAPTRPPKSRAGGGGAKYPAFPEADCDALWSQWGSTFGAVEYGTFRKALGPHYQASQSPPSVEQMADAIRAYREAVDEMDEREAGWQSIHKFAQRIEHWVRLGAMPHTNEWGELTERGRVLGSKAMREQERAGRMRVSA